MVIFNGKEMSSKFVRNNKIVEINSPIKDIQEALEKMRECVENGEPLSDFYISSFKYEDKDFAPITRETPEWNGRRNIFDEVLTETELEVYTDAAAVYERPVEFREYEKFQFNMETSYQFESVNVSDKETLQEFMAGYGILPTLWDEKEKSIAELKFLSKAGEGLVRMFKGDDYAVSKFNAAPPLNWIEAYQTLTPYEKRAISDGRIHPAKAMQIAKGLKDFANGMLLRQEMIDVIIESTSPSHRVQAKDIIKKFTTGYAEVYPEMIALADEVFKAKFRGHAPRVLSEYMEGALNARGINPQLATREQIEEIANNFSQSNVSRIAKYRAPILLALSEKVTMGNMKDNVLQAIGVNVPTSMAQELFEKGFPEWLNAHPDVRPEEVIKICSLVPQMTKIDVNDSPKDVIAKIELKKGYEDARRYEEKSVYAQMGYKFANNEIAIRGRNIVATQGNLKMRMLKADDYRNFLVGYDTHCCQHYGDAGESCVYKYTTDPFAACVVIERGDKIVAQGFVWTDEAKDTFVFDNVELDNDRDVQQFSDLFAAYAKALPYANVHVGTGYNQGMNGWGMKVGQDKKNQIYAKMPTTVDGRTNITGWGDGNCYSDYHTQGGSIARAIKHMGSLKLAQKGDVRVEIHPDEPTRWDELAKPDLNFMLNDWHKTPEERIALARQFRENPSDALQMQIVTNTPEAIISLDHPCHEAQVYIMDHYPELIWQIKDPCDEVKIKMVQEDPSYLSLIENPPEELILSAVKKDGTIIATIPNPSEAICIEAVRQNGYAIKGIAPEKQTVQVQLEAVRKEPKTIMIMSNPSNEACIEAVRSKPEVIGLIRDPSSEVQMAAVTERPSVINMIHDPDPAAVSLAIHQNGLLIRNFQRQYPELREVAIRQNGFALGVLHNPTIDEARLAIEQNANVAKSIKNEEICEALHLNNFAEQSNISSPEIEIE